MLLRKIKELVAVILMAFLLFTSCGMVPPPSAEGKIAVVTTIAPLYNLVSEIGGPYVSVTNLVPPGASEHTWEPTPKDIALLSKAHIVVSVGLGLEQFLPRLLDAAPSENRFSLLLSEYLKPLPLLEGETHDEENADHTVDPHVWLSPTNAKEMAVAITLYLSLADPEHEANFKTNLLQFEKSIDILFAEYKEKFAQMPKKRFFIFHNAFQYPMKEFGLLDAYAGVIEAFPGKELTPKALLALRARVDHDKVEVLFGSPESPSSLLQSLASELHLVQAILDPMGLPTGVGGYEAHLRTLLDTFIQTL